MNPAAAEIQFFQTPLCRCALKERAEQKEQAVSTNRRPISTRLCKLRHAQKASPELTAVDFRMADCRFLTTIPHRRIAQPNTTGRSRNTGLLEHRP
jgi:hypothetical protein